MGESQHGTFLSQDTLGKIKPNNYSSVNWVKKTQIGTDVPLGNINFVATYPSLAIYVKQPALFCSKFVLSTSEHAQKYEILYIPINVFCAENM